MLDGIVVENEYLFGQIYYIMVVICYGDYIVKISVVLFLFEVKVFEGQILDIKKSFLVQCDVLVDFFYKYGVEYQLCVQLCIDFEKMLIEDVLVEWDEKFLFQQLIGCFIILQQEVYSLVWCVFFDDKLEFNFWYVLFEYQLFGFIMCVCIKVYEFFMVFCYVMNVQLCVEFRDISEILQ